MIPLLTVEELRARFADTYPDLVLRHDVCPVCDGAGLAMMGPNLHPMFFCSTDPCPLLAWDPTRDYTLDAAVLRARADWLQR